MLRFFKLEIKNSNCVCRALRQYPVVPAIKQVDSNARAVVLSSQYPVDGTLTDLIYNCCDVHAVDTALPVYITQHLLSMLQFCHANKVCDCACV